MATVTHTQTIRTVTVSPETTDLSRSSPTSSPTLTTEALLSPVSTLVRFSHPSTTSPSPSPTIDSTDSNPLLPSSHGYGIAIWFGIICAAIAVLLIGVLVLRCACRSFKRRRANRTMTRVGTNMGAHSHRGWWRLEDESGGSGQGVELGRMRG